MAVIRGLGKVVVAVPGTPGGITLPADMIPIPNVHAFIIEALAGNAGKVYIGDLTLVRATLVGCFVVLPIPTNNFIPTFSCSIVAGANPLRVDTLRIDADIANDGVLVSAIVW